MRLVHVASSRCARTGEDHMTALVIESSDAKRLGNRSGLSKSPILTQLIVDE